MRLLVPPGQYYGLLRTITGRAFTLRLFTDVVQVTVLGGGGGPVRPGRWKTTILREGGGSRAGTRTAVFLFIWEHLGTITTYLSGGLF